VSTSRAAFGARSPSVLASAALLAAAVPAVLAATRALDGRQATVASAALPPLSRPRPRRNDLVRRVAQLAASGLPLPRILNGILAEMARDGLRGGSVALINDRNELYIAAWEGTLDQAVLDSRLPVGRGILGSVAATGRSLVVDDMDAPQRGVTPVNRNLGTNAQMRSILCVPLRASGQVIGVVEIDSDRLGRFGRDDLAVMERIAEVISGAAQQAGPLELANQLLSRRVHELMLLEDTARALSGSLEMSVIVPALVASAGRGLGIPYAALLQARAGVATVLASTCDGDLDESERTLEVHGVPTVGAALALAEPQTWTLDGHTLVELEKLGGRPGLHTAACVPVLSGEGFRGALLAASADARGFDPAELRLLQGIGHLAGLAVGNALSYLRLRESAATDALTGLLNRQELDRRLAQAHLRPFAVLVADVDRLKLINDGFGHEAGDAVLRGVAGAFCNLALPGAAVARSGGDEFSALVEGVDARAAVVLGEQMRRALYGVAVPFGLARVSVGVAVGEAGEEGWAVRDQAAEALDAAKRRGRDRVELAVPAAVPSVHMPGRRIEQAVHDLIDQGAVVSVYQPVVRLRDLAVVGYEALARPLGVPVDGSVEALFAAAHRTGLARDLDWLCRRAAVQNAHSLPEGVPLFVNVGVSALLDPLHDVDQMLLVLRWARRHPREVVLEITEREVVSDLRRFEEVIAAYRAEGFRFAIDDVGEGHSTLEVLAASNPEYIKVARSLTVASDSVGPRSAIHAVVAFARSSGAAIIAEGIETQRHADLMAAIGVDLGQGYHLGRPMAAPGRELRLPPVGTKG
jgi:diguanylate cyclase (GGDEF)-like protein